MAHLHAVPQPAAQPDDEPASDQVTVDAYTLVDQIAALAGPVDDHLAAAAARLAGTDLVELRYALSTAIGALTGALRHIDAAGNAWCWDHGTYPDDRHTTPVCDIGGVLYRPVLTGTSKSLKVDGKRRIANEAFRKVTDWACRQAGADPDDPSDDNALTIKLLSSNILGPLSSAFTLEPRREALAYNGDSAGQVPWNIHVSAYETEASSQRRKTFEQVPQPKTEGEK